MRLVFVHLECALAGVQLVENPFARRTLYAMAGVDKPAWLAGAYACGSWTSTPPTASPDTFCISVAHAKCLQAIN
jgi:hypothetical protein